MKDTSSFVVYDVEVLKGPGKVKGGWDNPEDMGFASAVLYDYGSDKYHFFLGEESRENLISHLRGRHVVTFNGVRFDSRVVLGNERAASSSQWESDEYVTIGGATNVQLFWTEYDILLQYVRNRFGYNYVREAEEKLGDKKIHDGSFSLNGLAEGTLRMNKTGSGYGAPKLYAQEKYGDLLDYNLHDVRLTRKLFDFIRDNGFVVDKEDRLVRMRV